MYIAFMDILGTKRLAATNAGLYQNQIETFQKSMISILASDKYKRITCHSFSDCAYFETNKATIICDFLINLREDLLYKGIVFNGAICKGELLAKNECTGISSSISFMGEKVVKVYGLQSVFSGAGIIVDEVISCEPGFVDNTISSIYKSYNPDNGKVVYVRCHDLRYRRNSDELLKYIVNLYVKNSYLGERISRYYVTPYVTYLSELDSNWFEENGRAIDIVLKAAELIKDDRAKVFFLLILINQIYEKCKQDCIIKSIDDVYYINVRKKSVLDEIFKIECMQQLNNIVDIPSEILNEENKFLLLNYYSQLK